MEHKGTKLGLVVYESDDDDDIPVRPFLKPRRSLEESEESDSDSEEGPPVRPFTLTLQDAKRKQRRKFVKQRSVASRSAWVRNKILEEKLESAKVRKTGRGRGRVIGTLTEVPSTSFESKLGTGVNSILYDLVHGGEKLAAEENQDKAETEESLDKAETEEYPNQTVMEEYACKEMSSFEMKNDQGNKLPQTKIRALLPPQNTGVLRQKEKVKRVHKIKWGCGLRGEPVEEETPCKSATEKACNTFNLETEEPSITEETEEPSIIAETVELSSIVEKGGLSYATKMEVSSNAVETDEPSNSNRIKNEGSSNSNMVKQEEASYSKEPEETSNLAEAAALENTRPDPNPVVEEKSEKKGTSSFKFKIDLGNKISLNKTRALLPPQNTGVLRQKEKVKRVHKIKWGCGLRGEPVEVETPCKSATEKACNTFNLETEEPSITVETEGPTITAETVELFSIVDTGGLSYATKMEESSNAVETDEPSNSNRIKNEGSSNSNMDKLVEASYSKEPEETSNLAEAAALENTRPDPNPVVEEKSEKKETSSFKIKIDLGNKISLNKTRALLPPQNTGVLRQREKVKRVHKIKWGWGLNLNTE